MTPTSEPEDPRAARRALRQQLIAAREALPPAERVAAHAAIAIALRTLLERLQPDSIGFTWPYRSEFDARTLVTGWLAEHPARWAALPVVGAPGEPMHYRRWHPASPMREDRYGIPFPAQGDPVVPALLLIPCNGFDARGYRLGYGAGHFDRTLAVLHPRPLAVGIALEAGRLDDLKPHAHDLPMQWVVTEGKGVTP